MPNNLVAYGFYGMRQMMERQITEIGVERVSAAVQESVDHHNRVMTALMADAVFRTVKFKMKYDMLRAHTLQPLDQMGIPRKVSGVDEYEIALPIQGGGTAYGRDRISRILGTVQEVNDFVLGAQNADADWLIRHILAVYFDNAGWTFVDDAHGSLSIEGLANGDSSTYVGRDGTATTGTNYLYQAGNIGTTNPYPAIRTCLDQYAANVGPGKVRVAYIADNLRTATEALTLFVDAPDAAVQFGDDTDSLRGTVHPGWGDETIGYVKEARCWIVTSSRVPDDYIVGTVRGVAPVVGMREYDAAALQGLNAEIIAHKNGLEAVNLMRLAGFGAWNRSGACVIQTENGSYTKPTAYNTMPLPI